MLKKIGTQSYLKRERERDFRS